MTDFGRILIPRSAREKVRSCKDEGLNFEGVGVSASDSSSSASAVRKCVPATNDTARQGCFLDGECNAHISFTPGISTRAYSLRPTPSRRSRKDPSA